MTILRNGLLNASPETKEIAAIAMGQLIALSDEAGIFFLISIGLKQNLCIGLKPHAINMAGPLIRVLGDRYPSHVKLAVLNALLNLLKKV